MVGHADAVKRQKRDRESIKYRNIRRSNIFNVRHRLVKRMMLRIGHTRMYKRYRMWSTYINENCARRWLRDNGYSTFAEAREKTHGTRSEAEWLLIGNPKHTDRYREPVYYSIVKDWKCPPVKLPNGDYHMVGEKSFDIVCY